MVFLEVGLCLESRSPHLRALFFSQAKSLVVLDDLVKAVKQLQLVWLVVLVQLDSESESLLNSSVLLLCHL